MSHNSSKKPLDNGLLRSPSKINEEEAEDDESEEEEDEESEHSNSQSNHTEVKEDADNVTDLESKKTGENPIKKLSSDEEWTTTNKNQRRTITKVYNEELSSSKNKPTPEEKSTYEQQIQQNFTPNAAYQYDASYTPNESNIHVEYKVNKNDWIDQDQDYEAHDAIKNKLLELSIDEDGVEDEYLNYFLNGKDDVTAKQLFK